MSLVLRIPPHFAAAKAMFVCQTDYAICKASVALYSRAQAALIEAGTRAAHTHIAVSDKFCGQRAYLPLEIPETANMTYV